MLSNRWFSQVRVRYILSLRSGCKNEDAGERLKKENSGKYGGENTVVTAMGILRNGLFSQRIL
jgi:hypothetical protein